MLRRKQIKKIALGIGLFIVISNFLFLSTSTATEYATEAEYLGSAEGTGSLVLIVFSFLIIASLIVYRHQKREKKKRDFLQDSFGSNNFNSTNVNPSQASSTSAAQFDASKLTAAQRKAKAILDDITRRSDPVYAQFRDLNVQGYVIQYMGEYFEKIETGIDREDYDLDLQTYLLRFFNSVKVTELGGSGTVKITVTSDDQLSLYARFKASSSCICQLAYDNVLLYRGYRVDGDDYDIFTETLPSVKYKKWELPCDRIILNVVKERIPYMSYSFTENNLKNVVMHFTV